MNPSEKEAMTISLLQASDFLCKEHGKMIEDDASYAYICPVCELRIDYLNFNEEEQMFEPSTTST